MTDDIRYLLPHKRDDDSRMADDSADTVCGMWRAGMVRTQLRAGVERRAT